MDCYNNKSNDEIGKQKSSDGAYNSIVEYPSYTGSHIIDERGYMCLPISCELSGRVLNGIDVYGHCYDKRDYVYNEYLVNGNGIDSTTVGTYHATGSCKAINGIALSERIVSTMSSASGESEVVSVNNSESSVNVFSRISSVDEPIGHIVCEYIDCGFPTNCHIL